MFKLVGRMKPFRYSNQFSSLGSNGLKTHISKTIGTFKSFSTIDKNLFQTLNERGFIHSFTGTKEQVLQTLAKPCAIYVGFDPTADSLHIGNLLSIMALSHFKKAGHKVIALVGGATGLIGDPSGKLKERILLDPSIVSQNAKGIEKILKRCFQQSNTEDSSVSNFKLVNNLDWYQSMNLLAFFRDIGKHFRISSMLSKESVQSRLESIEGISYTEFSYQIFQAYDFFHLYKHEQCNIQLGGSDQFGNITAGTDLIGKILGSNHVALGITIPLLTTSSGKKIGKSEGNTTIWLSEEKTSPYDFYQFFVRTEDIDVVQLLRFFTFLPLEEIEKIEAKHKLRPEERYAQKCLAREVTAFVFGTQNMEKAVQASEVLFSSRNNDKIDSQIPWTWDTLKTVFPDIPKIELPLSQVENVDIVTLVKNAGVGASKAEIRRLIQAHAIYLNDRRIESSDYIINSKDILESKFLILRSGKKNYKAILIK